MNRSTGRGAAARPVLVWFRRDLRLHDNAALTAAATGRPILPVYIFEEQDDWAWGGASRWWLHHSLAALRHDLAARGLPLYLFQGDAAHRLRDLAAATGAATVHCNRRYEPDQAARDRDLAASLSASGITLHEHEGYLLRQPTDLATGAGGPYKVFTPYYKKFLATRRPFSLLPVPAGMAGAAPPDSRGADLEALSPLPRVAWAAGLQSAWTPGEAGARAALARFVAQGLADYDRRRDLPAQVGTAALSPHLHWGEISPRAVWQAAAEAEPDTAEPFLRQLVWREFAHHLLYHFPHTTHEPLRPQFRAFAWDGDPEHLRRWQRGETGYPFVDAGMRQLWATGWMHNRVRMVVASFLVKHLLLPWQDGARWFWDTLVDANLANNTFGWQWTAGCGADAAPYFRIFNPIAQGRKFDADGAYIRHWVPELAGLPAKLIHEPWSAATAVLSACGVELGVNYPRPIVDHAAARERALANYQRMRAGPGGPRATR